MAFEIDGIKQYDYRELQEIVNKKEKDPIIIDVREPEEYIEGHIPNIPLIPMQQLPAMIEDFDTEKEYIFVCRSGSRSQNVARYLKENGFQKVHNYAEGMLGWEGDIATGMENVVKDVKELYK